MLRLGIIVLALGLAAAALAGLLPGIPGLLAPSSPAASRVAQPTTTRGAVATPSQPLETRVAAFARTVESGQAASIAVTEQEATEAARAALARRGEERVRDLALRFGDGRVEATATVALPFATVPVSAVIRPVVASDGTIDARVEEVRVAGGAPPLVEGLARSFVEEQIARSLAQPDWVAIRRLDIDSGQLRADVIRR